MSRLEKVLSIDLRALALFRIGLAGILLADLAVRSTDLVAHYTDAGILPGELLAAHPLGQGLRFVSVHLWHGSAGWQIALLGASAVAAVALLVGYRARAATLVSWLLLVSLQNRNPLVLYGADNVLVLMLFWCALLPVGARLSLDERAGRAGSCAPSTFTVAGAALLIQIACIHGVSAFHKRSPEWLFDGTAIHYTLHLDHLVRPLGVALREYPLLTRAMTHATLLLEALGPVLLFWARPFPGPRLVAIAAFMGLHLGVGLSLDVIHFSWLSMLTMVPFLPAAVLDRLPPPVGGPDLRAGEGAWRASRAASAFAVAALVFVLGWNVVSLRPEWVRAVESRPWLGLVAAPGHLLRLGQSWGMFAPSPPQQTRWHLVDGVLADGRHIDLLRGGYASPECAKPATRAGYYPSRRWQRVFANAPGEVHVDPYRALALYYCRGWSERRPDAALLQRVRIFACEEGNHPDGSREQRPRRLLARFECALAESS